MNIHRALDMNNQRFGYEQLLCFTKYTIVDWRSAQSSTPGGSYNIYVELMMKLSGDPGWPYSKVSVRAGWLLVGDLSL